MSKALDDVFLTKFAAEFGSCGRGFVESHADDVTINVERAYHERSIKMERRRDGETDT
jgi:hypothetical protein